MPPRSPDFKRLRTLPEMVGELARPQIPPDDGWYKFGPSEEHGFDFTNSWDNTGVSGQPKASWYLAQDGEVRMRGKVTGGDIGSTMFVLPEEVRIEFDDTFVCAVEGGGYATIDVLANGEVVLIALVTA